MQQINRPVQVAALHLVALFVLTALGAWAQESQPKASADAGNVEYRNAEYGFCVTLPQSWSRYTIIAAQWEGYTNGVKGDETVARGPLISIRNPAWRSDSPRQDIPIMVFTRSQWQALQQNKFYVSAAPFPPGELGRNTKYVFALPARYNYAFLLGYEEVGEILRSKPLHACGSGKPR
jgi:hypothetical protein